MSKILIIDDEEDVRLLYSKALEAKGHQALAVGTEEEAEEIVVLGGIDLVILDLKLIPPDSGINLLRWMRGVDNTMPIIINSAYPSYKVDFSTWLANEYLVKSGDLDKLMSAVSRLLGNKSGKMADQKS